MKAPWLPALLILGAIVASSSALASSTFAPQCVPGRVIPAPLDTSSGSYYQPRGATGIINNINNQMSVWANGLTTRLQFNFANVTTESNFDYMRMFDRQSGNPTWTVTGNVGTTSSPSTFFAGLGIWGGLLQLFTDTSVNSAQIALSSITTTTCSGVNDVGPVALLPGQRALGLLSGNNDVVYLQIAGPQFTTQKLQIAMWSDVPGVDFDLYIRCGAYPTDTSFTKAGTSSFADELVTINGIECGGQTVYIAVQAYKGGTSGGMFNLVPSYSWYQEPEHGILATTDFVATTSEINKMVDVLIKGFQRIYGMTEGGWYQPRIKMCNLGKCGESTSNYTFVFDKTCARSGTAGLFGTSTMCPDTWIQNVSGVGPAHEAGHAIFGLLDEYQDVGGSNCGHSMMGSLTTNLCFAADHLKDPAAGALPPTTAMQPPYNSWDQIAQPAAQRVPFSMHPTWTPDVYDYTTHHFGSQLSVTTTY